METSLDTLKIIKSYDPSNWKFFRFDEREYIKFRHSVVQYFGEQALTDYYNQCVEI